MAAIHDDVLGNLDAGQSSGTRLDILAADPGLTYATVTANSLGNSTAAMTGPVTATSGNGVMISFPAIAAGTVTNTSTANFWAITNQTSKVIASGPITTGSAQVVTSGNTFSLDKVNLFIRDATTA